MSFLDQKLMLCIFVDMALGVGVGIDLSGISNQLHQIRIGLINE